MKHHLVVDAAGSVLHVRDELDALSCVELRPVLEALAQQGQHPIRVDLSDLRLMDCWGVRALLAFSRSVRARGGVVTFVGVSAQPLVILKLLHLHDELSAQGQIPPGASVQQTGIRPADADRVGIGLLH